MKKFVAFALSALMGAAPALADSANGALRDQAGGLMQQAGLMVAASATYQKIGHACSGTCSAIWYGLAAAALGTAIQRRGQSKAVDYRSIENPDPNINCPDCNPTPPPDTTGNPTNNPTVGGSKKPGPGSGAPDPLIVLGNQIDGDIEKLKNDLGKQGIPTDPDSLKKAAAGGAGGADASKAFAMLSPELKAKFNEDMKNALSRYNVASVDFDGSGGSGGVGGHGKGSGGDALDFSSLFPKAEGGREPASAQGLSKSFNGDPIGVAQADIFKQVHDRYLVKQKTGIFILAEPSAIKSAAPPRKPSSSLNWKRH